MSETISFLFDGRDVAARPGASLAAALTEAGIRELREGPNGSPRGLFCGMGVCQDCLVEVNGKPNRRACMTKAEPGMEVRTQVARPQLNAQPEASSDPITENPDVLIIGGGAGGLSAAIAAAEAGADVLVLDERNVAGGQFYKQRADGKPPLDRQQSDGLAHVQAAEASGARVLDRTEVWGAFDGPVIYAKRDDRAVVVRPKTLIVASGAYERPRYVPGWDLPGVMTTGAAQTLWRSYGTLPGQRVAILGNGPLNFQVAHELSAGGAEVVVVAEAAPAPWLKALQASAMMMSSPRLTLTGLATTLQLIRQGVPLRYQTVVTKITKASKGHVVELKSARGTSQWTTDVVCMNYGFQPQNESLRLLGAAFDYDESRRQLICQRSASFETTKHGIFAVGDCCGMGGAPAALEEGHIAGRAAALRARGEECSPASAALAQLARHRRFQSALWSLFEARQQDYADIDAEALVCRCEGLKRRDIDEPASEKGIEIGGVKRATRAGMGRCQGRYCAPILAPHMAGMLGRNVDERSFFAPRVPIKPVEISAILAAGEADGEDV